MKNYTISIFLSAMSMLLIATTDVKAQTNIAPSATVTASDCWNCQNANDQNFGTCGSQQMFVWTRNPSTDYFQFEWTTPQTMDEVIIHHAQTTSRFLTGATIQAWNGSSFVNVYTFSNLSQSNCVNSVSFPPTTTTILRFTNLVPGTGQASNMNYREFEIIQAILIPENAAVLSLDSPSVFCEGTHSIIATIANMGTKQLDSVRVNWSLNGTRQPTVHYTSLLDTIGGTGSNTAQVTLGSNSFVSGISDSIAVWTSMPNGVQDTFPADDSLIAVVQPAIQGNFTIDAAGSGPNNYLTLQDAANDLSDFGVCGPVTFTMASGTYTGQVTFSEIDGASAINTITFMPDTSGAVTIEATPSFSENWVLNFDKSDWISFHDITIQAASGSSTYGVVLNFASASHNTFMNCQFNGISTSSTSNRGAIVYSFAAGSDYNKFMGCEFNNGSYGFYFRGSSTNSRNVGLEVVDCDFNDAYYMGSYFYYTEDLKFNHNRMSSSNPYIFGYGLYSQYSYNASEFMSNDINWHARYAFLCGNANGTIQDFSIIANNMIQSGDSNGYGYGLYVYGQLAKVVYNSVYQRTAAGYGYYGIYMPGGGGCELYNNLLYTPNGSGSYYAMYFSSTFGVIESDHNNIYAPNMPFGRRVAATYSTLSDWQTGTGFDMNSLTTNPAFTSYEPMRTCNDSLDGAGTPVPWVTVDFDGDDRDPLTPDIGADEWIGSAPGSYSAGDDQVVCDGKTAIVGLQTTGGSFAWTEMNQPTNVLDTNSTYETSSAGTYIVTMTPECGGGHIDTVVVVERTPTATFTDVVSFRTGQFTNTSNNSDDARWVVSTGDTIWSTDLTYVFPDNGPYTVVLTTYNDCDTVSSEEYVWQSFVGISETELASEIRLMPNPVSDVLNVQLGEINSDNLTVEMTNVQGQMVYRQNWVNINGNTNKTIDVSSMDKGMYLLRFITDEDITTKRVIVQ